jgi:hypothetical protein
MGVVSVQQLKNGYVDKNGTNGVGILTQPLSFIPEKDKDDTWVARYMDFIEYEGLRQIRRNASKLIKNYKLANAEIDNTDYVKTDGQFAEMISAMTAEGGGPNELKYYSLTDTVVEVLVNEFSKRASKVTFDTRDVFSQNDLFEQKGAEVEQVLLQQLAIKQRKRMEQLGFSEESEEGQQMMSPETIKSLPEIQSWYNTNYKNQLVHWAMDRMQKDKKRFSMDELERLQFKNMLITDREFWHFRMLENDYTVEVWNPLLTYYKKSPRSRYIADGMWVGTSELWTVSEAVDNLGWMMTEEQLAQLDRIYPANGMKYIMDGVPNDGAMYDNTQSYEWNKQGPGVAMRQFVSNMQYNGTGSGYYNGDIVYRVLGESEDMKDNYRPYYVRVSTVYWKTQRKWGRLIKIDEYGNQFQDMVSEDYIVMDKPLYDTIVIKSKTPENLIFGEHIEWTWVNEVWGGVKVGPAIPTWMPNMNNNLFNPIYLGMKGGKPGRLPFQFKGTDNLYNCKLPVEGAVFHDYNVRSRGLVDKLYPWQIGYNMMMNMVIDLNIDELGTILVLDQNVLPKHSLGEEWGEQNFFKALGIARDLSVLPVDTTRSNTQQAINPHFATKLDMNQTERILAKANLAKFFRDGALQAVGLTPERMGTPIDREVTATQINQGVSSSFAQTEQYFIDHCDQLMPRVHQMRTELAQFYLATNPSVRLQYSTDSLSKTVLEMSTDRLLLTDYEVIATTSVNERNILNQIQQLVIANNTSGATIFDLVRALKIDNTADMETLMNKIEARTQQEQQQKAQQDAEQFEKNQEQMWAIHEDKQAHELQIAREKMENDRYIAEVRSAGMSGAVDLDANKQNDYIDNLKLIQGQSQFDNKMSFEREKEVSKAALEREKLNLREKEIQAQNARTRQEIQVAKINNKVKEKDKKTK